MGKERRDGVAVNIYGESYTVVGKEQTSHVRLVADKVDDKMREIKRQNPYLDTKQLAVLTSVNFVSEYLKVEEELDKLKEKIRKEEE